jgi:KipI family sensor histidine kinase inhibitor
VSDRVSDVASDRVLRPFGADAVLAEVGSLQDAVALHAALAASRPPGVVELVPAARTVLVVLDRRVLGVSAATAWVRTAQPAARVDRAVAEIEVAVRYDGADLVETAALLGVSPEALVKRHTQARWTVAFTGFAPGFAYLASPDWTFDVPRLPSPRTRVPAGAVGVAGEFSGAYPRETPGGWRLLGSTDAPLFDAASTDPVLLPPGARVRFAAVRETQRHGEDAVPRADSGSQLRPPATADAAATAIRVVASGPLATVQDLGRPGRAHLGIARSGALDRGALRRANRLVGNPEDAAGIEITLGGFRAVAGRDLWCALTGAAGPVEIDGTPIALGTATAWPAGAELAVGAFAAGARALLAVRGGLDLPVVAGGRGTDVLAGLGPAPLAASDVLPVGPAPKAPVPPLDMAPWSPPPARIELALAPGPRADRFAASALHTLFTAEWSVSAAADRVGVRLDGPELARVRTDELPSEGMVPGALQVPPSGRPTVLLADGPVTGGYPVIAVVADADLDLLAQARPGDRVRFRHAH